MLKEETRHPICTKIVYPDGEAIAFSETDRSHVNPEIMDVIKEHQPHGSILPKQEGDILYGFALSQGFETYKTGWIAVVEEEH